MKKLFRLIMVPFLGLAINSGVAMAATSCQITGPTGPDSNNTCTATTNNNTNLTCINGVLVANITGQNAVSGNAQVNNNTTGGSATSGSASNSSTTTTNVNTSCGLAQTVKQPPTGGGGNQGGGGQGGGVVSGVSTTSKVRTGAGQVAAADIVALPETGENTLLNNLVGMSVGFMSVTAIWQLGLGLYRRLAIGQLSNFAI